MAICFHYGNSEDGQGHYRTLGIRPWGVSKIAPLIVLHISVSVQGRQDALLAANVLNMNRAVHVNVDRIR